MLAVGLTKNVKPNPFPSALATSLVSTQGTGRCVVVYVTRVLPVVLVLVTVWVMVPLLAEEASAQTYYVNNTADFLNAVRNAGSGDTIVFAQNMTIDLNTIGPWRPSGDGPRQEIGDGYWDLYNITDLTIQIQSSNISVTVKGHAIRLFNCTSVAIIGLRLDADVWVDGSDLADISHNEFVRIGHILWIKGGSKDYLVMYNNFTNGGGLLLEDVGNAMLVQNNRINGFPILYVEGNDVSISGLEEGPYGQVVVANSNNVEISFLNMTLARIGDVKYPIVITNSNSVTLSGIAFDIGYLSVYNSSNILMGALSIGWLSKVIINNSRDVMISNSKIQDWGCIDSHIIYVRNSKNVELRDTEATLRDMILLDAQDSENVVVKNNHITMLRPCVRKYTPFTAIYLENVTEATIEGNKFKANYTLGGTTIRVPHMVELYGVPNITVRGNSFTANLTNEDGAPLEKGDGVFIKDYFGIPYRNVTIEGNNFTRLSIGIVLSSNQDINMTINVIRNLFDDNGEAILLSRDVKNITIACNVFRESPIDAMRFYDSGEAHIFLNAFLFQPPARPLWLPGEMPSPITTITNDSLVSPMPIPYEYNSSTFTSKLGNYYSWHDNTDANGDGIADNPIKVATDNSYDPPRGIYDNYPIADPIILRMCGAPLPENITGGGSGAGAGGGTGGEGGSGGGGTGPAPPPLYVAPEGIVFPPTEPGRTVEATVTISNTGGEAVELTAVSLSGDAGVFTTNLSTPQVIPPWGSVVVKVVYAPNAYTSYSAILTIITNLTTQPTLEISLSAHEKKAPPPPPQVIENLGKRAEAAKKIGKLVTVISGLSNATAGKEGGETMAAADKVFQQLKQMDLGKLIGGVNSTSDTRALDANGDGKVDALDLVNYLSSQGLMKKPPKTTRAFSQQLLKTLQKLYGQNLENYPTPEGKLWVLALQIESTQQD